MKKGFFKTRFPEPDDNYAKSNKMTYNNINNKLTREYYDMLLDFSDHLSEIVNKLTADETVIEELKKMGSELEVEKVIPYCVLYDMSQIFRTLTDGTLNNDSVEVFGLVILSSKIVSKDVGPHLFDYKTVSESFYKGGFNSMAATFRGYGYEKNPISIDIKETENNEIISTKTARGKLSLPQILRLIDHPLYNDYITTLYRFATIIAKADDKITKSEESRLNEIYNMTHDPLPEAIKAALPTAKMPGNESLQDITKELDSLVGLEEVKNEVKKLINFIQIQKERKKQGLKSSQISYHCVFTGSPGTGKTTIARLISNIYKNLGILQKGQLVEIDRSGLVAEYTGQTAPKVDRVVKTALDGVLFIDEAYSLVIEGKDDFGKEAVAALIKRMEDNRDKLVLIVAGYQNEMKTFIDSNPGFKSRFNRYIQFPDYTPDELLKIFELLCNKSEYKLTNEAGEELSKYFKFLYSNKKKDFGNARLVRNTFEKTIENQSNRIANLKKLTKELLTTIEVEDIPKVDLTSTW